MKTNAKDKPVAVVVGATSKWQADGRNTKLAHGKVLDDSDVPVGIRWGIGGAVAQKFAKEGFFVVLTTRTAANAAALEQAIKAQRGDCMTVELDLVSQEAELSHEQGRHQILLGAVTAVEAADPDARCRGDPRHRRLETVVG